MPDRARGFLLAAPDAAVYDVGTAFSLHVDEQGIPEVEVTSGEVEFSLLGDDGNTFLNQRVNESTRIRADRERKALVKVDRDDEAGPPIIGPDESALPVNDDYVRAVLRDGPALYWRFDGNVLSSTAQDNGLRLDGSVIQPSGEDGVSLVDGHARFRDIDGAPRYIVTNEPIEGINEGAYSIELWMKPEDLHHATCLGIFPEDSPDATKHLNVLEVVTETFLVHDPGSIRFLHRHPPARGSREDANAFTPGMCTPGQWQHVVAIKKTNELKIFLNGECVRTVALIRDCDGKGAYHVVLGQLRPMLNERQFVGSIDELAIYRRALSDQEIENHFRLIMSK